MFFWTVLVFGFICSMVILIYDKKKTAQEHGVASLQTKVQYTSGHQPK